jgi:hypothetical protein
METKKALLFFFVLFNTFGCLLIIIRTGDYDADLFTKILGWMLYIPTLIVLFYYYNWWGLFLFIFANLLALILKISFKRKE